MGYRIFRRLLWVTPIVILIGSLVMLGYALLTHNVLLMHSAINGVVMYAPSSAVIFWGMIYELDESQQVMRLQKARSSQSED